MTARGASTTRQIDGQPGQLAARRILPPTDQDNDPDDRRSDGDFDSTHSSGPSIGG